MPEKTWTKLYSKSSSGKIQEWSITVEGAVMITTFGQVGGKLQETRVTAEAKNVGRSNETSPEQQALLEAEAQWVHKKERKYTEDPSGVKHDVFLPMLAPNDKWADTKKNIKYPAYFQPKLDGNRSVAREENGEIVLTSRDGKAQDFLPHINEELKRLGLTGDNYLDGELYCHGESLQTINSWIKKHRPESMQIKYYLYDMPIVDGRTDLTYAERIAALTAFYNENLRGKAEHIVLLDTFTVNSEEEVMQRFAECREQGYEGGMAKNLAGVYKQKSRSRDIAKVKPFEDAEFKVVDFTGMEVYKDEVLWICETKDGKRFKVTPNGTREQRREWFKNGDQYIGKILTVTFMGYTEDGIPNIAKGKAFRLESDLPENA